MLCLENDIINIDLICGHKVCIECYKSDMKCLYKKKLI